MLLALPALAACDLVLPYLEEVRSPADGEVALQGNVLVGPPSGSNDHMEQGSLVFRSLDGELLDEASRPYSDSPDWWRATLPAEADYVLRIEAPGARPGVWRGRSPAQDGYWYTGSIFTWPATYVDDFFASLPEAEGAESLDGGRVAHLWGEIAVDGVAAADIQVTDGAGQDAPVATYTVDDQGILRASDTDVLYFFAFDLEPGQVTVTLRGPGGSAMTAYPASGGDLVSPWWMVPP